MNVYKQKGSKFWNYQFIVHGVRYRGSTKLTNRTKAQAQAAHIREQVVNGNVGILEKKPRPTLKDFLDESFLPFAETKHASKPNTLAYYKFGANQLKAFRDLGNARLDEITEELTSKYIASHSEMTPSGVNQGLRTLRRALRLAFAWKKLDRPPSFPLMGGEHQRTRVVTDEEEARYLAGCQQPWRTMATAMIELGPRPSEILTLRCEQMEWTATTIHFLVGKSKAAKRDLPMTDKAYDALYSWWEAIGRPTSGYLFPAMGTGSCHAGRARERKRGGSIKRTDEDVYRASRKVAGFKSRPYSAQRIHQWHHEALEAAGLVQEDGAEPIVPYTLRHSALTRLAENCPNPFAVKAAAGHESITTTQRYTHPQKAEIWAAFERKSGHKIGHSARTKNLKVVREVGGDGQ